jgi:hypothetical protein
VKTGIAVATIGFGAQILRLPAIQLLLDGFDTAIC